MWQDWKQRQAELVDKADFYEFNQLPAAAQWIRQLSESVATPTSRNILKRYLNELFSAWVTDFAANDELRKKKANSISIIVLSSFASGKLSEEILTVLPILRKLGTNLDNLAHLARAFAPFRESGDYEMRYYGMCYHYALFVEGVFDESIRLLFLPNFEWQGKICSSRKDQ